MEVGDCARITENLNEVERRIAAAAERSGRAAAEIRLVVVTKTQPVGRIQAAVAAGAAEIGENYVQEAEEKLGALTPPLPVRHLIGHLQRNKAGKAAALFDMVQSVDSVALATALGRRAAELNRVLDVLVEVNIAREASKFGVSEEEALEMAGEIAGTPGVRLRGLMGIGPLTGDAAATRASFRRLRGLFEQLPAEQRQVLSMGMTGDFETAIEEGSTMVRVGTAIFGARANSPR